MSVAKYQPISHALRAEVCVVERADRRSTSSISPQLIKKHRFSHTKCFETVKNRNINRQYFAKRGKRLENCGAGGIIVNNKM